MKIISRQLERDLRKAVQRDLRQSPELWREYSTRRWGSRIFAAVQAGLILLALIGIPILSLVLSMPLLGFGDEQALTGQPNEPHIILGVYSLVGLGFLMIIAGGNNRAYVRMHSQNARCKA
jgi:hypothetical protein